MNLTPEWGQEERLAWDIKEPLFPKCLDYFFIMKVYFFNNQKINGSKTLVSYLLCLGYSQTSFGTLFLLHKRLPLSFHIPGYLTVLDFPIPNYAWLFHLSGQSLLTPSLSIYLKTWIKYIVSTANSLTPKPPLLSALPWCFQRSMQVWKALGILSINRLIKEIRCLSNL